MREYKCLSKQSYSINEYQIVPIRDEDKYDIMQWRNNQIYHLRQSQPLTKEIQDEYFRNVIQKLFEKEYPDQLLFSYLENGICVGYGGLVHINWIDSNAELSFLIKNEYDFNLSFHWLNFLKLIAEVSFADLCIHKIYTFAYDLRPKLFEALELSGFIREATLKEHCFYENKYIDVVIHSKTNEI